MGGPQHADHLMQVPPIVFLKRHDHRATEGRHGPRSGQNHEGSGYGSHLLAAAALSDPVLLEKNIRVRWRVKNKGRDLHDQRARSLHRGQRL